MFLDGRVLEKRGLDALESPSVLLSREEHTAVTSMLRNELPYGQVHSPESVWRAYQNVYSEAPEWLGAIEPYFRKP